MDTKNWNRFGLIVDFETKTLAHVKVLLRCRDCMRSRNWRENQKQRPFPTQKLQFVSVCLWQKSFLLFATNFHQQKFHRVNLLGLIVSCLF